MDSVATAVVVEEPYVVREGWGHAAVTAHMLSDPDFALPKNDLNFEEQNNGEFGEVVQVASPMIMHVHSSAGGDVFVLDVLHHDPAPVDTQIATAVKVEDGELGAYHDISHIRAENAQKVDRRFGHRSAEARASVSEGMRIKAMKVRPATPPPLLATTHSSPPAKYFEAPPAVQRGMAPLRACRWVAHECRSGTG